MCFQINDKPNHAGFTNINRATEVENLGIIIIILWRVQFRVAMVKVPAVSVSVAVAPTAVTPTAVAPTAVAITIVKSKPLINVHFNCLIIAK